MAKDSYLYGRTVRRYRYDKFKRRLRMTIGLLLLIVVVVVVVLLTNGSPKAKGGPTSTVQTSVISDNLVTTISPYFKFQDTSKWVLDTINSTPTEFIYSKFNKLDPDSGLTVYINQVPIPLYLAVPRVLPVRIFNGNAFDVTQVSDPCGKTYGPTELHKEKVVTIDAASMLCDPDSPQYTVILSQVNGDYRLNLKRQDGTTAQYVIIYRGSSLDSSPNTLLQVAKTFQAL